MEAEGRYWGSRHAGRCGLQKQKGFYVEVRCEAIHFWGCYKSMTQPPEGYAKGPGYV